MTTPRSPRTEADPLTVEELAKVRAFHHPLETMEAGTFRCNCDFEPGGALSDDAFAWPCEAARLVATLEAAAAAPRSVEGLDVEAVYRAIVGNADDDFGAYEDATSWVGSPMDGITQTDMRKLAEGIAARLAAAPRSDEGLREAANDLYRLAVGEHGHDETHSADWPSCLPAHIAMNRYRAALVVAPREASDETEVRANAWAERVAAGGLGATTSSAYQLGWNAGFGDGFAAAALAPKEAASLGICPVCHNLFREVGHAFDCPLAAALAAAPREASEPKFEMVHAGSWTREYLRRKAAPREASEPPST